MKDAATMLTIPNIIFKLAAAVRTRLTIFLFIYLTLAFSRTFITASPATNPLFAIWANVFLEATIIIIFGLLYSDQSIGRDVNTINFYSLLSHLIYLPCYYQGYQVGEYHNYAIKFLEAVFYLRLCYFGNRALLAHVSVIGFSKQWLLSRRWFVNSYINGLTGVLFAVCAIPLFTMIWLINTDQMRASGIGIVLFVFFIATEYAKRNSPAAAAQPTANLTTPAPEIAPTDLAAIEEAKRINGGLLYLAQVLAVVLGLALIIGFFALERNTDLNLNFGYAIGYADGKAGKKPQSEVDLAKLVQCYNPPDLGTGRPAPPGPECDKVTSNVHRQTAKP
jgi:hypothetical protein